MIDQTNQTYSIFWKCRNISLNLNGWVWIFRCITQHRLLSVISLFRPHQRAKKAPRKRTELVYVCEMCFFSAFVGFFSLLAFVSCLLGSPLVIRDGINPEGTVPDGPDRDGWHGPRSPERSGCSLDRHRSTASCLS